MNAKKLVCLLLALVMALALVACGGSSTAAPANNGGSSTGNAGNAGSSDNGGAAPAAAGGVKSPYQDPKNTQVTDETIVIGMGSEPSTIWGAAEGKMENEGVIICGAMMDRLVKVDYATKEVLPWLAKSWEWVDGTHCRFVLREDAAFPDGTPLTAEDVAYTVGVWKTYSPNNDTGSYVVEAKAEDEHTVVIEFTMEAPELVAMMSWTKFGIVSEKQVEAAGGIEKVGKNPVVGSGPYIFKEWVNGQKIVLERNENYWDKDYKGYFKTMVFNFTADPAAREMAVESGDAMVAYDMPVSMAVNFTGKTNVSTYIYSDGGVWHLWYNMGEKAGATKDIRVRQAIDLALDYDALNAVSTGGYGTTSLSYFDTTSKYYQPSWTAEERAQNISKAKELLADAGYADGLTLHALGLNEILPLYTVIQENLRQAGITLELDMVDVPQFVGGANGGDYDIIEVGEELFFRYPTMMGFLRWANINTFWIGGPKWTNDEIEGAIYAALSEKDETKAKDMMHQIDLLMKEYMVCSNICPEMKSSVTSNGLRGFTSIERGYIDPTTLYRAQ